MKNLRSKIENTFYSIKDYKVHKKQEDSNLSKDIKDMYILPARKEFEQFENVSKSLEKNEQQSSTVKPKEVCESDLQETVPNCEAKKSCDSISSLIQSKISNEVCEDVPLQNTIPSFEAKKTSGSISLLIQSKPSNDFNEKEKINIKQEELKIIEIQKRCKKLKSNVNFPKNEIPKLNFTSMHLRKSISHQLRAPPPTPNSNPSTPRSRQCLIEEKLPTTKSGIFENRKKFFEMQAERKSKRCNMSENNRIIKNLKSVADVDIKRNMKY